MHLRCVIPAVALACSSVAVAAPTAKEVSLGAVPTGAAPHLRVFTKDLSQVAQVACADGGCAVFTNGVAGPRFDSIVAHTLRFTRGGVVAYAGRRGAQTVMVVAGKEFELPAPLDAPRFAINPAISLDGNKAAAVTVGPEGKTVRSFEMSSGSSKDYGPYVEVFQAQYTNDSRLIFSAKRAGKWVVVTDGVEGVPADTMGLFAVSPNGQRVGYSSTTEGVTRYSIDGVLSEPVGMFTSPVEFSPDSQTYAYSYMSTGGPMHYVLNGKITPGTSSAGLSTSFIFSPDSKHVAYVVADDKDRQAFSIDGVIQPYFKIVNELKLWSDSKRMKFVYSRIDGAGKPAFIYTGGRTPNLERYEGDIGLSWAPDGKSFTYKGEQRVGSRTATAVFVDGKRITPVGYDAVHHAVFSLQGHQTAHIARGPGDVFALIVDGKKRLNIDGMPLTPPVATAEGFSFIVQRGAEHRRIDWQAK